MRILIFLFAPLLVSCQSAVVVYQDHSQLDIRLFGAKLDGTFDDTDAFNAALDSISADISKSGIYAEGTLTIDGDRIDWTRCSSCSINIYVSGALKPLNTIKVPSYVSIIGLGGYRGSQFAYGPTAQVWTPPNGGPGIEVTGVAFTRLENLSFQYNPSPEGALSLGSEPSRNGSALNHLKNISILVGNEPGAVGMKIYSNFWVHAEQIAINAQANSEATIKIVNSKCVNGNIAGFMYFRDMILSSKHVLVTGDTLANCNTDGWAAVHFDNVHFENRNDSPMFTFDTRGWNFTGLTTIDELSDSDCPGDCSPHIRVLGNQMGRLRIRDASFQPSIEGVVDELEYDAQTGIMYSSPATIRTDGLYHPDESIRLGGEVDGLRRTHRGHSFAPQLQVASAFHPSLKNTPQELKTLDGANIRVLTGQSDPVLDTNAVRITKISGPNRTSLGYWNFAPKDSTIIGVTAWVKGRAGMGPNESFLMISLSGPDSVGIIRDNNVLKSHTYVTSRMSDIPDNGWMPVTKFYRIRNPGNETRTLTVNLELKPNSDFYLFGLTCYHITEDWNELDKKRWANSITYQKEGAPKGVLVSPAKGL